jgi:hypothetical protein
MGTCCFDVHECLVNTTFEVCDHRRYIRVQKYYWMISSTGPKVRTRITYLKNGHRTPVCNLILVPSAYDAAGRAIWKSRDHIKKDGRSHNESGTREGRRWDACELWPFL